MTVQVNAQLIKTLRDKTNAGLLDCKQALIECNGDIEKAIDWLRTKGLITAQKKSSRIAAEGLVAVGVNDSCAIVVEVNAETDFVARNEKFQNFVSSVVKIALTSDGTIESLSSSKFDDKDTVHTATEEFTASIGEHIVVRRMCKINKNNNNLIYSYVHGAVSTNMGRIGVILSLNTEPLDKDLGKQLAMHIAANNPKVLNRDKLDKDVVAREREVQMEIVKQSGKPQEIIDKMLEGKLSKFYSEVVLEEQSFIMDPSKKVTDVLKANKVEIIDYAYFLLGDGIDKPIVNFADEVIKIIK